MRDRAGERESGRVSYSLERVCDRVSERERERESE